MRRLAMDFQPVFMSGYSLRKVDQYWWASKVRPRVVPQTEATCCVCGFVAEDRLLIHADEVWGFSSPPHVELIDVRPLCTKCHEAKDFAQTLVLIEAGVRDQDRETEIRRHYCAINTCSDDAFDADFEAAAVAKRKLELEYGCNTVPTVDYGQWGRPKEMPRISREERRLLKTVFEVHGEVFFGGRPYRNLSHAVRALQALPVGGRSRLFTEIESALDYDEDFEMWPDHECPWDIKMNKD